MIVSSKNAFVVTLLALSVVVDWLAPSGEITVVMVCVFVAVSRESITAHWALVVTTPVSAAVVRTVPYWAA